MAVWAQQRSSVMLLLLVLTALLQRTGRLQCFALCSGCFVPLYSLKVPLCLALASDSASCPLLCCAAAGPLQQQPRRSSSVDELNDLPCARVRCSSTNLEPVCATGKGLAGCVPADKGCTYTNGCLARCVYGATIAYLGECTHRDAMRITEQGASKAAGSTQQPAASAASTAAAKQPAAAAAGKPASAPPFSGP